MRVWALLVLLGLSILMVNCQSAKDLKFKNNSLKNKTVTAGEMEKYVKDPTYWQPKVDFVYREAQNPQPKNAGKSYVKNSVISTQITGGWRALPTQFPWQILLVVDQSTLCGGSLISTEWVMTVAHCVDGGSSFFVAAGGVDQLNDRENGKQTYLSTIAIMHENYDPEFGLNNIALVNVNFFLDKNVNLIRLPRYSDHSNKFENRDRVVLSGYGKITADGDYSRNLMYVYMKTVTNNVCARLFSPEYVPNSVLCTRPDLKRSACFGDGGNALTIMMEDKKYTVIGLVSSSPDPCAGLVTTYTRVTSFLGWISRNTGIKILT